MNYKIVKVDVSHPPYPFLSVEDFTVPTLDGALEYAKILCVNENTGVSFTDPNWDDDNIAEPTYQAIVFLNKSNGIPVIYIALDPTHPLYNNIDNVVNWNTDETNAWCSFIEDDILNYKYKED